VSNGRGDCVSTGNRGITKLSERNLKLIMKKLFVLLLFASIQCSPPLKEQPLDLAAEKSSIDEVMDAWHDDAATGKFEGYFGAMDSLSIFYGTDATENWTKQEFAAFAEPHFDEDGAWKFQAFDRNIYFSDSREVAWFDELLNTWMGVCIGSGVLEKKDQRWKIKHYVLSVIVPNDDIMPVLDAKRANDSLFIVSKGLEPRMR